MHAAGNPAFVGMCMCLGLLLPSLGSQGYVEERRNRNEMDGQAGNRVMVLGSKRELVLTQWERGNKRKERKKRLKTYGTHPKLHTGRTWSAARLDRLNKSGLDTNSTAVEESLPPLLPNPQSAIAAPYFSLFPL